MNRYRWNEPTHAAYSLRASYAVQRIEGEKSFMGYFATVVVDWDQCFVAHFWRGQSPHLGWESALAEAAAHLATIADPATVAKEYASRLFGPGRRASNPEKGFQ
jgi:hypothetical protein